MFLIYVKYVFLWRGWHLRFVFGENFGTCIFLGNLDVSLVSKRFSAAPVFTGGEIFSFQVSS